MESQNLTSVKIVGSTAHRQDRLPLRGMTVRCSGLGPEAAVRTERGARHVVIGKALTVGKHAVAQRLRKRQQERHLWVALAVRRSRFARGDHESHDHAVAIDLDLRLFNLARDPAVAPHSGHEYFNVLRGRTGRCRDN
jgi:hypothetical protein